MAVGTLLQYRPKLSDSYYAFVLMDLRFAEEHSTALSHNLGHFTLLLLLGGIISPGDKSHSCVNAFDVKIVFERNWQTVKGTKRSLVLGIFGIDASSNSERFFKEDFGKTVGLNYGQLPLHNFGGR